jgi:putative transposase
LPIRKHEKLMQGFRSWPSLQRFTAVFSAVRNLFVPARQKSSAFGRHLHRTRAFAAWRSAAGIIA